MYDHWTLKGLVEKTKQPMVWFDDSWCWLWDLFIRLTWRKFCQTFAIISNEDRTSNSTASNPNTTFLLQQQQHPPHYQSRINSNPFMQMVAKSLMILRDWVNEVGRGFRRLLRIVSVEAVLKNVDCNIIYHEKMMKITKNNWNNKNQHFFESLRVVEWNINFFESFRTRNGLGTEP